jgi:hypothetical protein
MLARHKFVTGATLLQLRAGQPKSLNNFGRLQKDTKTDELMMEDLGKYVINTGIFILIFIASSRF